MILSLDTLHALNLGVFKDYVKAVFWACLRADVWDTHARTQTKVIDGGIPLLRSAVFRWYADKKAYDPADTIYQLQDLTPPMLGSNTRTPASQARLPRRVLYWNA